MGIHSVVIPQRSILRRNKIKLNLKLDDGEIRRSLEEKVTMRSENRKYTDTFGGVQGKGKIKKGTENEEKGEKQKKKRVKTKEENKK